MGNIIRTLTCEDRDDVEEGITGTEVTTYIWDKMFDVYNRNVSTVYDAITNDPKYTYTRINIALADDMTNQVELYNLLKQTHPQIEISLDISNNQLLDDYSKVQEQYDIIDMNFDINEIQQISIDIEPHAFFNRKDDDGNLLYPDWPTDPDKYYNIFLGLVDAIVAAFPGKYFSIATPTFFPAWVYHSLYTKVDCIYIMYYVTFNDGKLQQIKDIYNVFKSKKAFIIYQIYDFDNYDELDARREDTAIRSEVENYGFLALRNRVAVLLGEDITNPYH